MKNEHLYVREWLRYHYLVGIRKFYLFDHGSSPPLSTAISDFVSSNVVVYRRFQNEWRIENSRVSKTFGSQSPQSWAYETCLASYGRRHTFMANIDVDEFIIIRRGAHPQAAPSAAPWLPALLQEFEPAGGLLLPWQLVGPSGHLSRPPGGTLASFTRCLSAAAMRALRDYQANPLGHMKSVINTRWYTGQGCDPHRCHTSRDLATQLRNTSVSRRQVHWQRVVLYHFITRSKEEYLAKLLRGSGHSQYVGANARLGLTSRKWRYYHMINASADEDCLEGVQMAAALAMTSLTDLPFPAVLPANATRVAAGRPPPRHRQAHQQKQHDHQTAGRHNATAAALVSGG